ncbi:MAG: hypothetical protein RLZZ618_647 [Pseudomonadota bacterium]
MSFALLSLLSWTQARDPECDPRPVGELAQCESPSPAEDSSPRGIGNSFWLLVTTISLGGLGAAALTFNRRRWVGRIPIE